MELRVAQDFRSSIGSADGILDKLKKHKSKLTQREFDALGDYYGNLSNTRRDVPVPACIK